VLNVLFVRALAARIPSAPNKKPYITITAINPGFCLTAVRKNQSGMDAFVSWVFEKWLARTQEEGSRQLVWAALAGLGPNDAIKGEELHGQYCSAQQVWESSDWVIGAEGRRAQDVMWVSNRLMSSFLYYGC
jgi:retinol dehydrogenase-12